MTFAGNYNAQPFQEIIWPLLQISVTCFEVFPSPVGTNRPEKSESTETQVFSWDAYSSFTFDKCQASLRYNNNFINIAPFKYLLLPIKKKHMVKANKTKLHAHVVVEKRVRIANC